MDLVHSPRRRRERGGAPFGLRPHSVPLASKNISLFYRKEDLEKSRLRGRLQLFFINPLCGDFQLSLREFYLSLITLVGVRLVSPSFRCLVAALVSPPQRFPSYIPQTPGNPARMAPLLAHLDAHFSTGYAQLEKANSYLLSSRYS